MTRFPRLQPLKSWGTDHDTGTAALRESSLGSELL